MSGSGFDAGGSAAATADWLDRALADDGFTARVMSSLPAPIAAPAWRKPAVTALWGIAAVGLALALPSAAMDVAREAFKVFSAKPFALSEIAAVLAVVGLGTWSTAYYTWRRA